MDFHEKQFAVIEFLLRMRVQKREQPGHELRNDLRMVVQLNADDAQEAARRIAHDVGEIPIEGEENGPEFLGLGDDDWVERADGQGLTQQRDMVAVPLEGVGDLRRDALVAEEVQAHAETASKSARSRA